MELGLTITVQSGIFLILDLYVLVKAYKERKVNEKHRFFTWLAIATSVYQLASFLVRMVKNKLVCCGYTFQNLIYMAMFVAMVFTAWGAMCYLVHLCDLEIKKMLLGRILMFAPCALISFVVLTSPWTHWFFYIDSELVYHRGTLFFLQIIGPGFYTLVTLVLIIGISIRDKKKDFTRVIRYLTCFIVPPLCGMIMQIVLNVDGGYSAIGVSICVILLYMEFYIDEIRGIELLKEQQSKEEIIESNEKLLQKALVTANIEVQRNEVLINTVEGGKFSYEISADDEVVAANYSEISQKRIGAAYLEKMDWVKLVHPDDKEQVLAAFWACVHDYTGQTPYDVTFRMMGTDGKYRWVRSGGNVVRHPDGSGEFIGISLDITGQVEEKARHEKQLQEAEDAERLVKSVAGVYRFAFAFDMKGSYFKVIRMDDEVRKVLNNAEFNSFDEAIAPLFDLLHPADIERMTHEFDFETIREKLKDNFSYNVEYRVMANGGAQWHEMNVTHINNDEVAMGFIAKDLEITKHHIEEKRFRDYFGLYEVDIESEIMKVLIDSPYYTFSETLEPVPYTQAMKKFAESQQDETREFFLNLSDLEWVKKLLSKDDRHSFEYYSVTAGNTWVDVTSYVTMRDDNGVPTMFALGFSFISATGAARQDMIKKELEQQKQLEEALAMAEVANKAKTDFLFNMSHDIRTPMNAIIGFTNIARKEIHNPEKALDSLEKVRRSSDILLNLINDVLDMSRIESGKVELYEEKYNINEAFENIEPAMANLAASKDIDLQFSFGKVKDRYIFADGTRFDRVLINIISNAIKYTPAEGFVKVSAEQIEDTKPGYGNYRFTVADSGIGMSEDFQKHMFEDFTREENSTTRGVQGTGLGLALAKKLVDKMGGSISCISAQGIGTTFTIDFPFRLQTEADMAEKDDDMREHVDIDFSGKRVLLVEDNELNREIADDILSEEGIIVETAGDGQKAVNKIRERGADYYDFILMDIQMPVMGGYEATALIHKLMPEFKTPIIALSANAFQEDRERSIKAGMDGHVAKPINISELFSVLEKFL